MSQYFLCESIFKKRFLKDLPDNKFLNSKLDVLYNGINPIKQLVFKKKN